MYYCTEEDAEGTLILPSRRSGHGAARPAAGVRHSLLRKLPQPDGRRRTSKKLTARPDESMVFHVFLCRVGLPRERTTCYRAVATIEIGDLQW